MNNVWMVTSGSYSDYHVDGVFSTEEKAIFYIKMQTGRTEMHGHYSIDEREIDSGLCGITEDQFEDGMLYQTEINMHTGDLHSLAPSSTFKLKILRAPVSNPKPAESWKDCRGHPLGYWRGSESETIGSYVSQDHANKLAVEYRQAWLRHGQLDKQTRMP